MICRGRPAYHGSYACWMHGVARPTVIRIWNGEGWVDHLGTPIAGTVAGWLGPLPIDTTAAIAGRPQEFDL